MNFGNVAGLFLLFVESDFKFSGYQTKFLYHYTLKKGNSECFSLVNDIVANMQTLYDVLEPMQYRKSI